MINYASFYHAYGLNIKSSILLQGQQSKEMDVDITIIFDNLDTFSENFSEFEISENSKLRVGSNCMGLFYRDIEICRIMDNFIIINSTNNLKDDFIRINILSIALPLLLIKRGLLMLHANVVNMNGNAVAFIGPTGIGKSTISAFLQVNGYDLLSDDVSCFKVSENDYPIVFSGFTAIKLWPEIIKSLGKNPELMPKIHSKLNKRFYDTGKVYNDRMPLKSIYFLKNEKDTFISEISPQSAVLKLINNTLFAKIFDDAQMYENLKQCTNIVKNVPVKQLNIKHSLDDIQRLVKVIEKDFFDSSLK